METRHLLGFIVSLLARFSSRIPEGSLLYKASLELEHMLRIIKENPRRIMASAQRELMDHYLRHLTLWRAAGGKHYPKHHLMVHGIERSNHHGNMKYHTTYLDEDDQGSIARLARSAHRSTFAVTVFSKRELMQQNARM